MFHVWEAYWLGDKLLRIAERNNHPLLFRSPKAFSKCINYLVLSLIELNLLKNIIIKIILALYLAISAVRLSD